MNWTRHTKFVLHCRKNTIIFSKCYFSDSSTPCDTNPCQNNGSCVVQGKSYACICVKPQFTGLNCEKDTEPCKKSACNATFTKTCRNVQETKSGDHTALCVCDDTHFGPHCDIKKPCVANPCQNNGQCLDGISGDAEDFVCVNCSQGYGGKFCEKGRS